jgi:hypothetical protein
VLATLLAAASIAVTDIRPITLHPGINTARAFAPDGKTAMIVQAWRGNGNAHGYHIWLVLTPDAEGQPPGAADIETENTSADLIRDDPFDGERTLGVIRFARAKVNGKPASILIDAHLDDAPSGVLADHATATIRIYQLSRADEPVGDTPDVFKLISTLHTTRRFCNAEMALKVALDVPLSADYGGANQVDGCF